MSASRWRRRWALLSAAAVGAALLAVPTPASAVSCPIVAPDGVVSPAPVPGSDWSGCDLSGADLHGLDLSGSLLTGTRLVGANLSGADLHSANLVRASLDRADLSEANLASVNLYFARMVGATVSPGTSFSLATMTYLAAHDLVGSTAALPAGWRLVRGALLGRYAVVSSVDLSGADLSGLVLADATLNDVNLAGADLSGANLANARLTAVAVDGVVMTGATMTAVRGVNLTGQPAAAVEGQPRWSVEAGLLVGPKADLSGARLVGTDLSGRDLSGVRLWNAVLTDVNLDGASLTGASTSNTVLMRPHVQGLDLTALQPGSYLRVEKAVGTVAALPGPGWLQVRGMLVGPSAFLVQPDLRNLDLTGVDLTNARLDYADFSGSDLSGVSLAGSYLYMPRFVDTSLQRTRFGGSMQWAIIGSSDARGADFTGGAVEGATFVQSDFTGAIFTDNYVGHVWWEGSTCPDALKAVKHLQQDCLLGLDTTAPRVTIAPVPTFLWSGYEMIAVRATATDQTGAASWAWSADYRPAMGGTVYTGNVMDNQGDGQSYRDAWLYVYQGMHSCVRARARDVAGNLSSWSPAVCSTAVTDESSMDRSPYWRSHSSASYWGGGFQTTTRKGDWLRTYTSGRVRQVGVVAATCPTCGSVALYVGSTKVGSINLARSTVRSRTLITLPRFAAVKYGKVKLVVTSGSTSTVKIDALAITGY